MRGKNICLITILLTFLLLLLGGLVHNTESSLACPDWPLCYGQVFPEMKDGVLIEHSHRLLASLVGFFTILLVWFSRPQSKGSELEKHIYSMSWLALFLVILQGILGGITVIYSLPTIVSTSHLALSMIYFCSLVYIFERKSNDKIRFGPTEKVFYLKKNWSFKTRHGLMFSVVILYLQMILGAFLRHVGAGASCGLGVDNTLKCLDLTTWKLSWWPVNSASQLHMTHRYLACIVAVLFIVYCTKVILYFMRNKIESTSFQRKGIIYPLIIIVAVISQIALGIMSVSTNIGILATTLHLGGAALILSLSWKLFLMLKEFELQLFGKIGDSIFSDLADLTKPKLSTLVVSTSVVGLALAPGHIDFFKAILALVLITMVVMGGTTLNCYLEMDVDLLMERTKNRPLPSGRMDPKFALFFGTVLAVTGILCLGFFINWMTAFLSLLAAVLYLFAYTPLKKKSAAALYVGAIPGAIPPILGWTSVTGELGPMAMGLFAILFVWQIPHFLALAIYHKSDYFAASLKVYPNLKGVTKTVKKIFIYTIILFGASLLPIEVGNASMAYKNTAIFLGGAFLLLALKGFFANSDEGDVKVWARKYFLASVFYLPLLLGALIYFR